METRSNKARPNTCCFQELCSSVQSNMDKISVAFLCMCYQNQMLVTYQVSLSRQWQPGEPWRECFLAGKRVLLPSSSCTFLLSLCALSASAFGLCLSAFAVAELFCVPCGRGVTVLPLLSVVNRGVYYTADVVKCKEGRKTTNIKTGSITVQQQYYCDRSELGLLLIIHYTSITANADLTLQREKENMHSGS